MIFSEVLECAVQSTRCDACPGIKIVCQFSSGHSGDIHSRSFDTGRHSEVPGIDKGSQ